MGKKFKRAIVLPAIVGFLISLSCASLSNLMGVCLMSANIPSVEHASQATNQDFPCCPESREETNDTATQYDCCASDENVYLFENSIFFKGNLEKPQYELSSIFAIAIIPTFHIISLNLKRNKTHSISSISSNTHRASILQVFII